MKSDLEIGGKDGTPELPSMPKSQRRVHLRFRDVTAIFLLVLVVIVFGVWIPHNFLRQQTIYLILNENAVPCFIGLGLIIPLTAGVFDLSVGYTLGTANVFCAWLLGHSHLPAELILLLGVLVGAAVGIGNGLIVVVLGIDSFIGTLASGSLLEALILVISHDEDQTQGITHGFTRLINNTVHGVALPVFYVVVVAFIMWYFLEHRPVGRELRATGLGMEAARLVGVRVNVLRFWSLVVSGAIAGLAGGILVGTVGGGSPDIGPPYLIPAFTAVFLGATQLRAGLFNVWGTVLGMVLLGTVTAGLALANVPIWVPDVVSGVVLIGALTLTRFERRRAV